MEVGPVIEIQFKNYKCSLETFKTQDWSEQTKISLSLYHNEITARQRLEKKNGEVGGK
jgi:hypothetical protein